MKCLLCSSKETEYLFSYKGKDIYAEKLGLKKFNLKWYVCNWCGVYFSHNPSEIDKLYSDSNLYDAQYDAVAIKERYNKIMNLPFNKSDNYNRVLRVKKFYKNYKKIYSLNNKKCHILDIGAGMGVFLANFKEKEYIRYALELNPIACKHIKNILKIPVYKEYVQNLEINIKYNLITFNKVLEHIDNPIEVIKSLDKISNLETLLYIELPDTLGYEILGDTCDAFGVGHYLVYNPNSLYYLFETTNYEILCMNRILEPSGKYTIYSFVRRKNYEIL